MFKFISSLIKTAILVLIIIFAVKGIRTVFKSKEDVKEVTQEVLQKKLESDMKSMTKDFTDSLLKIDPIDTIKIDSLMRSHQDSMRILTESYSKSIDRSNRIIDTMDTKIETASKFIDKTKDYTEESLSWIKSTYNSVERFFKDLFNQ